MSSQEFVAIFWDYENCPPASGSSGYKVVDYIRRIALQFGVVTVFKAYLELEKTGPCKVKNLLSELQASGVSLIDCPHNGCKEVADKMLLVDLMAHAIDHPAPGTVIIISGDRDFVYAVSTLRLRRYRVIVIASSQIHISLHRQASSVYAWNGGKAYPMQPPTLPLCEEIGSQNGSSFDRDSLVPYSPALSPFPSPFHKDGLRCASHPSPCVHTRDIRASKDDSGRFLVEEEGVGRHVDTPVLLPNASERKSSLSGACYVLEGESPPVMTASPTDLALDPSATASSWRSQQEVVDHLLTSTTEALVCVPLHGDASLSTGIPVREQSATGAAEPRLQINSSASASVSNESFRLVGEYPRRIIQNMKRRDRVVVWRRRLARSTSDANTSRITEFVPTNQRYGKHNLWNKCRMSLVSLLTIKHGTSTSSISSGAKPMAIPATSTPSSSSPSSVTASVPSTTISSPAASQELKEGPVDKSAEPSIPAVSCPVADDNVEPSCDPDNLLRVLAQSADIISTASYPMIEPLSQLSAKDGDNSVGCVADVTCMSQTPTTASAAASIQTAVAKDERSSTAADISFVAVDTPGSRAVRLSEPVSSNATIANSSVLTEQFATTPTAIRSRSKFVVLVEELRYLHCQGQPCPKRSIVAEGLMSRNPLTYQQAGITSGKKFNTYINLAVQAGVVTVGGEKEKWISLNPAWLNPPAISGGTTSSVVSTHTITNPLVTSSNTAMSRIPETSSAPTENTVPPRFVLLVERLKRLESKNVPQPFRSLVAVDLVQQDNAIYKKAGVNNFDAYAALAEEAGIVTLGGEGLRAWISLKI